jgi:hypothetical protein
MEVGIAGNTVYIDLFTWIDSEMLHASWGFMFDSLTVIMLITVTTVLLWFIYILLVIWVKIHMFNVLCLI